ncbi:hypothetical protein HN784_01830 [bacterium]|jgi:hypothetical protein|nr:hypothetical protein [bacterium]MBT4251247.1 hypothetical protein [bacterium]MBT4598372.1 hypothetical protein [bacterium]MBT6754205.1 hypothetical protein [bacterium]MBT7038024.1 hypothetical protein [bacterium]
MPDFGKKLEKKLEEARRILATTKRKVNVEKLEQLSEEIKKGFEERIEKLSQKRNLIAEAIRSKFKLRKWKVGVISSILKSKPWVSFKLALSAPFIYSIFIPAVIFHLFIELYHQVAFRLYGIPLVKMKDYFVFDRVLLSYLNWLEKINCLYCSYVNCLIAYSGEIGGRTERFWCPIKHARKVKGVHSQYGKFVDYLDGEEFRKKQEQLSDFSKEKQEQAEEGQE